jgi:hypothetical protein
MVRHAEHVGVSSAATSGTAMLDWVRFSQHHFPQSRRHDLRALEAYGRYRKGEDFETLPVPLSLFEGALLMRRDREQRSTQLRRHKTDPDGPS